MSKTPKIIGIDPGVSGAIAVVQNFRIIAAHDFPTIHNGKKNVLDPYSLATLFDCLIGGVAFCVFENVHSLPRDKPTHAFTFGHATGIAEGILCAHKIQIRKAEPGVWKTMMGVHRDKEKARQKAISLFPQDAHLISRKQDHNRAEAALLALLGEKYMQ